MIIAYPRGAESTDAMMRQSGRKAKTLQHV